MMKRELHLAITVIGFVLFVLIFGEDSEFAHTILFITLIANVSLHIFSEYIYYRRNNAVIASSQFLLLPYTTIILTQLLEYNGLSFLIFSGSGIFVFRVYLESLFVIPFFLLTTVLTSRYYQKRYTGFVLSRKMHGPIKFPFFFHTFFVALLVFITTQTSFLGINGMLFIVTYVLQLIFYLIKPSFESKYDDTERREYMNRITRSVSPSRRGDYSPAPSRGASVRPSSRQDISSTSKKKKRRTNVSTTPSGGYRQISTGKKQTSSNPRRKTSQTTQRSSTSRKPTTRGRTATSKKTTTKKHKKSSSSASVGEGIEVVSRPKTAKVKSRLDKNMLPQGNVVSDDLKCMVCYGAFDKKGFLNVILCPHCKYPAHEDELNQWLFQSPQCPRCAKPIKGKLNNKLRISEGNYAKLIKKL